jgi:hypothetical protein
MIPPSNINKPRQFLRPGPPFPKASVQAEPQSPMPESAQQSVSWQQPQPENISWQQQPPVTGSYSSQVYETDFTAAFSANPYAQSLDTGAQTTPPAQPSFQDQQGGQFATGNHNASPFSPFAPGGQRISQFQPFGTSKQGVPNYPVTGKQQTTSFEPSTGQQEVPFYQPQPGMPPFGPNTGRQEAAPYQPQPGMPPFGPFSSNSAAFATPPSTTGMADPAFVPFPMTGPQYTPPFAGGLAGQQMNNFQAPASPPQSPMGMPGFSNFSTGQRNAFPMPGMSGMMPAQEAASWSTTSSAIRSATIPEPSSRKQASTTRQALAPSKPLKRSPAKKKGLPLIVYMVCLVLLVGAVLVSQRSTLLALVGKSQTNTQQGSQATSDTAPLSPGINTITNNKDISPFLFGTNMALFHDTDEPILNSAATRQQLKNIGVRIIRMPVRTTLKPSTEIAAARDIKAIGASALVVMHGPEFKDAPLFDADQQVISNITGVFGNQPVYFEFGNESDLNGIDVNAYIAKWNQIIPLLKKQFPTARFIALDNYQFTRLYLKTFLQQANPLPDGVSWHEYTCSVKWSAAFCLANIDTWPVHFAQARAAMKEAIGKELPIWISEWNYTSDQAVINGQPINDGKYNDPAFMKAWTTKAMQALVDGRVFAAMQYFATNLPMALVSNDQVALEGQIFQQNYKTIMVDGKTPPAMYYTGPPPPVLDPNAQYSFENGLAGWSLSSGNSSQPTVSTAKALDGTHSLHITLPNVLETDTPTIAVNVSPTLAPPKAGQMISTYIYVSNPNALMNAKIFVSNAKYQWQFANSMTLTSGTWTKIWYSLPLDYTGPVFQFGIQLFTSHPGVSTDVYVDQFEWK